MTYEQVDPFALAAVEGHDHLDEFPYDKNTMSHSWAKAPNRGAHKDTHRIEQRWT
jgi:hypothetical protein